MDMNDEFAAALAVFMEEVRELLAQMEEILLRAEAGACSEEDLPALFACAMALTLERVGRRRCAAGS